MPESYWVILGNIDGSLGSCRGTGGWIIASLSLSGPGNLQYIQPRVGV
ncbi:hypothetical protein VTL71DRAFT_9159 [Oculimacula yallundae]|uniref:Uncharacterized protein n=1 Tax=Oculimacula yallundae TaxID=86028 RepID=A0ABR4BUZ6_9HELO